MSSFILVILSGAGLGGLYFLVASGLSLIYGLMHVINLAHGVLLSAGAYASWWLIQKWTDGPVISTPRFVLAVLFGMAVVAVAGLVVERVLIRPLYHRHVDQILVTVGIWIGVVALFGGIWGSDPRPFAHPEWLAGDVDLLGASIPTDRLVILGVSAFVLVALLLLLKFSRFGLIVRAGVENRQMVTALGINVQLTFALVFALGASLAALGGSLAAVYQGGVSPGQGTSLMIYAFMVVIIGGFGTIIGTAVAAAGVGIVQQAGNFYLSTGLGDIAVLLLLATVLLVRPSSLAGRTS